MSRTNFSIFWPIIFGPTIFWNPQIFDPKFFFTHKFFNPSFYPKFLPIFFDPEFFYPKVPIGQKRFGPNTCWAQNFLDPKKIQIFSDPEFKWIHNHVWTQNLLKLFWPFIFLNFWTHIFLDPNFIFDHKIFEPSIFFNLNILDKIFWTNTFFVSKKSLPKIWRKVFLGLNFFWTQYLSWLKISSDPIFFKLFNPISYEWQTFCAIFWDFQKVLKNLFFYFSFDFG